MANERRQPMRCRGIRRALVTVFAFLVTATSFAQNPEADSPTRIGVVNLQRAVEGSPEFLAAGETWTVEMNRVATEVAEKQEELRAAQEQLAIQQSALNETARLELVGRIERLETELDRAAEDGETALNGLREQLLVPITQQVDQLLLTYARSNGFDLVIDASNPNSGVIFSDDLIDITDPFIEFLEAASDPDTGEDTPLQ